MSEEVQRFAQGDPDAPINIKIIMTSTGEETIFTIKRSTKLGGVQRACTMIVGKDVNSIRLLYGGLRIAENDTPASLDMEENDTIDVTVETPTGGFQ